MATAVLEKLTLAGGAARPGFSCPVAEFFR